MLGPGPATRWNANPSGIPLLLDALVAFECVVVNEIHSGTHAIFIGQVIDVRCRKGHALTYQRGAFSRPNLAPGPTLPKP